MCNGDIGKLFLRFSFCVSNFIGRTFFPPHSLSPIGCTAYSNVAKRVQHIRKWSRGIEKCLIYIHRDDRTDPTQCTRDGYGGKRDGGTDSGT
jgi:hypothetical protein